MPEGSYNREKIKKHVHRFKPDTQEVERLDCYIFTAMIWQGKDDPHIYRDESMANEVVSMLDELDAEIITLEGEELRRWMSEQGA